MKSEAPAPEGTGTQHSRQADNPSVADGGLAIPDLEAGIDALTAALAYAACGWYVLPVRRGTKHPGSVVGDDWQHQSSIDPEQIVAWFAGTEHGIALHCGRSGAVVFDVDQPGKLPDILTKHLGSAPCQSTRPDTTGRGHYVFAMPPGRVIGNGTGRLGGAWGEIRGLNGVIIVEPSEHPDGGEYRWERTGTVPVLPNELAELLYDAVPGEDAATDAQVAAFLAEHTSATRPSILNGWISALNTRFEAGSRHNAAVSVTVGALKEAAAGYLNARTVVETLGAMFVAAATRPPTGGERQRTEQAAADEYRAIVAWAVGQAMAADPEETRARTEDKMPTGGDEYPQPTGDDSGSGEVEHTAHLGMAKRLGQHYAGELLYVNKRGWHYWDGKRYAPDETGLARRAVHALLKRERQAAKRMNDQESRHGYLRAIARMETSSAITGILTEAAALAEFSVAISQIDADPWLFNCHNGTLDLRTGELHDHRQADRITKVANASYRPDEPGGAAWRAFLETVLPDEEVRSYTQRITGLGLLGKVNGDSQIMPVLTGTGANGKTTFLEAVAFALGDYAMTAEPTLLMAKRNDAHPTGIADLLGKRFVSVVETEQGRRFDITALKWLTGGDRLKARFMRQDFFEFLPSHLLVLVTNHLPRIDDDSEAVWRRVRVIPFDVLIAPEDRDTSLGDQLQAEADTVLTWLVQGWLAYRQRDGLDAPERVMTATNLYKSDSDPVGRFIEDECDVGGALSKAKTKELYHRWEQWAKRDGCRPLSMIAFGRKLDDKGYPAEGGHHRWRHGIALRSNESAGEE